LSKFEGADVAGRLALGKFQLGYNAMLNRSPVNVDVASFDAGPDVAARRLLLDLGYGSRLTSVISLRSHAYLNADDEETTFYASWVPTCPDPNINCRFDSRLESIVAGVEATPSFDWFHDGTFVTLVGGDVERRSGRSILNEYNRATDQPVLLSSGLFDRQDVALAAYAQQQWDPVRWLGFNVAGRLEDDPRFSPALSPRIAVRVNPWAGGTVKLIYSQAFRAPSFYETYFNYPLQPASVGLRPESEQSVEGSIEQAFGAQRLLFGAFATRWTDLIDYYRFTARESSQFVAEGKALLPPSLIERNLGSIDNWGFNAAFEGAQLSNALQYGINFTAALALEHEGTAPATPLPVSPRAFGNAHVSYDLPGDWPTLALAASAQSARPFEGAFTSGFFPVPYSPAQCILHATVSGPFPGVRGLSYRLTGFYAATDREPYRFGPPVGPSPQTPTPSFVPIDRARAIASLTYEF
jgi:outer membrane receptor protein involved in Fe transport